jgi:hypothetical protein
MAVLVMVVLLLLMLIMAEQFWCAGHGSAALIGAVHGVEAV